MENQLSKLMELVGEEGLKSFVLDYADEHPQFKADLTAFIHENYVGEDEEDIDYRQEVEWAFDEIRDEGDRIGYYGEHLVLLAQTLGLNTCWVGLSYKKIPDTYVLEEGEVIKAYIAIGYGETQGASHKIKTVEQVSNVTDVTPSWFKNGVEAALLAPTAVNQQKFSFEYVGMNNNRHQVRAKKGISMIGYTQMDLGIAKYHFEIGAGKENFIWV